MFFQSVMVWVGVMDICGEVLLIVYVVWNVMFFECEFREHV
jgi:hypothetical protein